MDKNEEYHDPDYPESSVRVKEEAPDLSEQEREARIRSIIQREFKNEIDVRENEVMLADQRMATARRMLHRLRCALVSRYYRDQRLQQPDQPESSSPHRSLQRRLHPSVRKLLGNSTTDVEEIFRPLATRHRRRDYSAMVAARNYTIPAGGGAGARSLRPVPGPGPAPAEPEPPPAPAARPTKTPRHIDPKPEGVLTLDEVTRNKMKHRYRIIIGNTSKYAPAASAMDRSTHKWLLYVRGPTGHDAAKILRAVVVTLHHSYAPHHIVHIDKPPYHISRRGWGEFPARVELHFRLPDRNRPATVDHTIKLDRHYTGLQTLGAETLVDVWLYSTPDMLECEYAEPAPAPAPAPAQPEPEPEPKPEPAEPEPEPPAPDSWLDFFTENTSLDVDEMIIKPEKKPDAYIDIHMDLDNNINHIEEPKDVKPDILALENSIKTENNIAWSVSDKTIENPSETIPTEILSQPASPKKRIMKYLDPKTGKIYYLEMDRNLDLSKVQEIVINSKGNMKTAKLSPVKQNGVKKVKKGVSLLKPEVKNLLNNKERQKKFCHIQNDHCYLGASWAKNVNFSAPEREVPVKKEMDLYECLCSAVTRLTSVRMAVNYLLKKVPIVSEQARDPDFKRCFPFTVDSDEKFWKMDFAKRRNKEWSRAKLINTILTSHLRTSEPIWRTKQILIFSRLHLHHPRRAPPPPPPPPPCSGGAWDSEPGAAPPTTASVFRPEDYQAALADTVHVSDDEDVEVVGEVPAPVEVKQEEPSGLAVLPVQSEQDRLRFLFVERACADIGLELRNECVGSGYQYSAVHAVLLSALRSFAEELVRSAHAAALLEAAPQPGPPPVWTGWGAAPALSARCVARGAARGRLAALSARDCGARRQHPDQTI